MCMRKILILLLAIFPVVSFAQKEITIEGPSDKVASVTVMVNSDFDQSTGTMTLSMTGFGTDDANTLWLLKDPTVYKQLKKYFRRNRGKLKLSGYSKKQIAFLNLKEKTALSTINVTGAEVLDLSVQTNTAANLPIQKQIVPLDNHSKVILKIKVQDDADKLTVDLRNPVLLVKRHKKCQKHYLLSFVGKDASVDFDLKREYCERNAYLLVELKEYDSIFGKCEALLNEMKTNKSKSLDDVKKIAVSELRQIDMKRFENSRCQDVDNEYAKFKALKKRIEKFETGSESNGGGGGKGAGEAAGNPADEDCNFKKVNDDIRTAVIKMNTYANDWISATDPAVKKAKKLAFDSLVKDIDAKINALTPTCRKKLDGSTLKNYQAAKKLITH